MPRVVIVAPTPSHPRFHKRAEALLQAGYRVDVYAFNRGYYRGNSFPAECKVTLLPTDVTHGRYGARLQSVFRAASQIKGSERSQSTPDLIYAFGMDNAITALLSLPKRSPLIYEFGDLRGPQLLPGWLGAPIRMLEKWILRRCTYVVVTAPAFAEKYIALHYPALAQKAVVVENRLPHSFLALTRRPVDGPAFQEDCLRVGIVGFLRYEAIAVNFLAALDRLERKVELRVFGDGPGMELFKEYRNPRHTILLHGEFKNPDDLPSIYSQIDLNVVLYDTRDVNVRWALPNKLYESAFFGVPILASSGTEFARRVSEWGIGYSADPFSPENIAAVLDGLTGPDLQACSRAALATPDHKLLDDGGPLANCLASIPAQQRSASVSAPHHRKHSSDDAVS